MKLTKDGYALKKIAKRMRFKQIPIGYYILRAPTMLYQKISNTAVILDGPRWLEPEHKIESNKYVMAISPEQYLIIHL